MKDYEVRALALASGYSVYEVRALMHAYALQCIEDGEDFDAGYFVGVTLERDW